MIDKNTGNVVYSVEVIRNKRKARGYICPACKETLVGIDMKEKNKRKNTSKNGMLVDRHCAKCDTYIGTDEYFTL